MQTNKKAITPIIATILLVVVAVILVTIILNWGREFTNTSLDKTKTIKTLSVSDAGAFVYPKSFSDGVLAINYQPPSTIQEPVIITSYKILEIEDMETVVLSTPITLTNNSTSILDLECLYEYSVTNPQMTIQLITEDNTYITVKQRDLGMVCTSGGTGTLADPKIVCNAEDLNDIRTDLDANYSQGKNIDLQCFSRQDENGWEPIGTQFTGSLNGQNKTISNLYINRPTTMYNGLFRDINAGAVLTNIKLEDINIIAQLIGGGLVGINSGLISNSSTSGSISSSDSQGLGGLAGFNAGTINNSSSSCLVSGTTRVGGFVGINTGQSGLISNCFSTGDVYGTVLVGGFAGTSIGGQTITNSYSLGNVIRLSGTSILLGGFFGGVYLANGITIINCYSTGSVSGDGWNPTNKGFVGGTVPSTDANNFFDTTTSLQTSTAGNALAKTTTEMKTQSTFTGWDFSTVWAIQEGVTYPYLRNNPQSPLPQ